eukprot:4837722-Amphidinium_carterae.1
MLQGNGLHSKTFHRYEEPQTGTSSTANNKGTTGTEVPKKRSHEFKYSYGWWGLANCVDPNSYLLSPPCKEETVGAEQQLADSSGWAAAVISECPASQSIAEVTAPIA